MGPWRGDRSGDRQWASGSAGCQALIAALAQAHRDRFIRIDVTEDSGLSPWLSENGLPCVGHAKPMVRTTHTFPNTAETDAHLFALSNQSIG
ncbi:hypothetical protein VRB21_09500 [Pseudomonas poae]